jgi:hypothetical protein
MENELGNRPLTPNELRLGAVIWCLRDRLKYKWAMRGLSVRDLQSFVENDPELGETSPQTLREMAERLGAAGLFRVATQGGSLSFIPDIVKIKATLDSGEVVEPPIGAEWSDFEVGVIRECYEDVGPEQLSAYFFRRSSQDVRRKARELGLSFPPRTRSLPQKAVVASPAQPLPGVRVSLVIPPERFAEIKEAATVFSETIPEWITKKLEAGLDGDIGWQWALRRTFDKAAREKGSLKGMQVVVEEEANPTR